ncbi:MAG TPA: class I SAM-dependent methyltransferase [Thermodesulfobacteriota bacterium]|nr:class I SAM-dependent methyltransferase [Thermodesulfobacteriota bacterium]
MEGLPKAFERLNKELRTMEGEVAQMTSYIGRHAELYDIFYGDKPYADEAAFVHGCLQQHSVGKTQRLLELACGTGSHAFALEKVGYEIIATDYSEDMLSCARVKAKGLSSRVTFMQQDMRMLDIPGKLFDAGICLFDSIGYVETNEELTKVLQGVHRHLRSDGLFIFEFWHAAAMLRSYDPVRVRRWRTPDGELLRISETELEYPEQLARVTYTIYELRHDGTYASLQEKQTNRYFLVQEMAGWLSTCGFTPIKWFAGFSPDGNITEQTWHIVAVARKSGKGCEVE